MKTTLRTVHTHSMWCNDGNHDKLYRLEMQEHDGKFDVMSYYGRRGGKMTLHVWAENATHGNAKHVYFRLLTEKYRKGYRLIEEDAAEVGKALPRFRS